MIKALFVFDHKFLRDLDGNYYYSSGFDAEFFKRYMDIFGNFSIFGRMEFIDNNKSNFHRVEYNCQFTTIKSNKRLFSSGATKLLRKAVEDSDCIVARMPSILGSLAIIYAKLSKKPYVVEVVACTFDALIYSSSWKRRILAGIAERFYRLILRNNPYTIYVTEEYLQKKYPSIGKQISCSNVTLLSVEEPVLVERLNRINTMPNRKKLVLGTCSTLGVDFKGQQYVIRGMQDLINKGYDIEYQLVGDGDGQWLMEIAKKVGVQDRVKILGSLKHENVFKWLDTIDLYIHPSLQEGLSRAIIEAMSRGCPVIAFDTGGIHELINDKYIVTKRDIDKLNSSIIEIQKKDMRIQAINNHTRAKNYTKEILYSRRQLFYNEFMKEVGLK